MKLIRNGVSWTECDGCAKKQLPGDEFDPFFISYPAGFHQITQGPLVKYLYESIEPLMPRQYHCCPNCAARIRSSLKDGKIREMPASRLRTDLLSVLARRDNKLKGFQIHFMINSRLAKTGD
jgi:hypothetical protein